MADTAVAIAVQVKGLERLKRLDKVLKKIERLFGETDDELRDFQNRLDRTDARSLDRVERELKDIGRQADITGKRIKNAINQRGRVSTPGVDGAVGGAGTNPLISGFTGAGVTAAVNAKKFEELNTALEKIRKDSFFADDTAVDNAKKLNAQLTQGSKSASSLGVSLGLVRKVAARLGLVFGALGALEFARLVSGTAKATARLDGLRIALQGVVGTETPAALQAIQRAVEDFNQPVDQATESFTQLAAAAGASGFNINEVEGVYRGLAAATKALGKNNQDLQGILLATTQVFSKGRVSAEELRGQIGERLAGAFADFATASGISTAELDKNLERGEVSLDQFVKFSEFLLKKYEKDAKKIADSPNEAGARLTTALAKLRDEVGPLLRDIGAAFQNLATIITNSLTGAAKSLNEFFATRLNALANVQLTLGAAGDAVDSLGAAVDAIQFAPITSSDELRQFEETINRISNSLTRITRNRASNNDLYKLYETQIDGLITRLDTLRRTAGQVRSEGFAVGAPPTPTTRPETKTKPDEATKDNVAERLFKAKAAADLAQALLDTERKINAARNAGLEKEVAILQGQQQILDIRNRLELALAGETNELVRQQLILKANLNAEKVSVAVAQQLVELDKERTEQKKAQLQAALALAGVEKVGPGQGRVTEDPSADRRQVLERARNVSMFGQEGADFIERVRSLVLEGVSFSEAFELEKAIDNQNKLNEAAAQTNQLYAEIGDTFANSITDAITGAIDGTRDLNEVLSDTLKSVGRLLINAGVRGLGQRLDLPGFAEGGRPEVGKPAIVGERGPELFIPDSAGTVVPNDEAFNDARSALVDTTARPVDVEEEEEAFAVAAGALARNTQTINDQSREREVERTFNEQMATAGTSQPMNIRFDSRVINSVEYVTAEQFQKGIVQTAKETRAQVFSDMKNKPSVRRQLGI